MSRNHVGIGRQVVGWVVMILAVGLVIKFWIWPLFLSIVPSLIVLLGIGGVCCAASILIRHRRNRL